MEFNTAFRNTIPELFNVEGLVAVITGGGTGEFLSYLALAIKYQLELSVLGIGLMMATALESNGAIVYMVGRRVGVLNEAVKNHSVRMVLCTSIPIDSVIISETR